VPCDESGFKPPILSSDFGPVDRAPDADDAVVASDKEEDKEVDTSDENILKQIDALAGPEPAKIASASTTLQRIAEQGDEFLEAIVCADGVTKLLHHFPHHEIGVLRAIMGTLAVLSRDASAVESLKSAEILPVLMRLMAAGDAAIHGQVITLVGNLVEEEEELSMMVLHHGIVPFVIKSAMSMSEEVSLPSLRLLRYLAFSDRTRMYIL